MKQLINCFDFFRNLRKKWSYFTAHTQSWSQVSHENLVGLESFLRENEISFKEMVCLNLKEDNVCFAGLKDIHSTLRSYAIWFCKNQSQCEEDLRNSDDSVKSKAMIARSVFFKIAEVWVDFIELQCPMLRMNEKQIRESDALLVCSDSTQSKETIQKDREVIMSNFQGTEEQQLCHLKILLTSLKGNGGKQVALIQKGAADLNWIYKPFRVQHLKTYFGVTGTASAIRNVYNSNQFDARYAEDVIPFKAELLRAEGRFSACKHN